MINRIKLNAVCYDEFVVTDSAGNLITGLVDGNFTRDLYDPAGNEVSGAITVAIVELGTGKYRVDYTPNKIGNWVLTIYHATYFTWGKSMNYRCETNIYLPSESANAYKADVSNLDVAVSTRAPANEYDTQMGCIPSDLSDVPTDSELDAKHGAGSWETGGGGSDWGVTEREQIRDALGVDGAKTKSTGGVMQRLKSVVDTIMSAVS